MRSSHYRVVVLTRGTWHVDTWQTRMTKGVWRTAFGGGVAGWVIVKGQRRLRADRTRVHLPQAPDQELALV